MTSQMRTVVRMELKSATTMNAMMAKNHGMGSARRGFDGGLPKTQAKGDGLGEAEICLSLGRATQP